MTTAPHRLQPPIQWLRLLPLPRIAPPPALHAPGMPHKRKTSPSAAAPAVAAIARSAATSVQRSAPIDGSTSVAPTPDLAAPAAPAPRSAVDIMQQARRDLAGIDRALRKEHPEAGIAAPPDSKQARLERGFEAAHAAVLPKWYEGATMEEITGGDDRKRVYRVKSAFGMFCITLDQDGKKNYTNCPQ